MRSDKEKQAFAQRLREALFRHPKKITRASDLAREFNLRHRSDPITQQAAHRWLSGSAFPRPDKLDTIAKWLKVDTEWLLYGKGESPARDEQLETLVRAVVNEMLPDALLAAMEVLEEVLVPAKGRHSKAAAEKRSLLREALRLRIAEKVKSIREGGAIGNRLPKKKAIPD